MSTTITALVIDVKRMNNTPSGNPIWEVTLSVASAGHPGVMQLRTQPDSSLAGRIDNKEFREKPHIFELTLAMRLRSAIPAGL